MTVSDGDFTVGVSRSPADRSSSRSRPSCSKGAVQTDIDRRRAAGRAGAPQSAADADSAGTGAEVLGSAPGRGQVEAHSAYRAAWRAAGLPEYDRDSLELSIGTHRARVQAWEREQAWGPAYVDNLLAGTRQAAEQHRQTAFLRRAEAAAAPEGDERDRLHGEAHDAEALAEQLGGETTRLEQVSDAYAEWSAETAMTRALADQSRAVLAMHEATAEPEERVTAEEWLAAERAARVADDPHREIADADLHQDHAGSDDARHDDQVNTNQDQREDGDPVEASRRTERPAKESQAEDDDADEVEPEEDERPETEVPDVRDLAANEPRPADEDTVRPIESDESEVELSRARRAVVEVANRRELDHQHEQNERAEQLSHWQDDDQEAAAELGSADDEADHGEDDY